MITLYEKLSYYTKRDILKRYNEEMWNIVSHLEKELYSLRQDVKTMGKYTSIFYRLKMNLHMFFNKSAQKMFVKKKIPFVAIFFQKIVFFAQITDWASTIYLIRP
jgi:hypothetical protein